MLSFLRDCPDVEICLSNYRAHWASMKAYPSCLKALSGLRLICHCSLDKKCHADVLISSFIGCFEGKGLEGDFVAKVGLLRPPCRACAGGVGHHPSFQLALIGRQREDRHHQDAQVRPVRGQRTLALHAREVEEAL